MYRKWVDRVMEEFFRQVCAGYSVKLGMAGEEAGGGVPPFTRRRLTWLTLANQQETICWNRFNRRLVYSFGPSSALTPSVHVYFLSHCLHLCLPIDLLLFQLSNPLFYSSSSTSEFIIRAEAVTFSSRSAPVRLYFVVQLTNCCLIFLRVTGSETSREWKSVQWWTDIMLL